METVSNLANTATTAASKIIWGDKAAGNETAGQEPVAGEEGKGTIDDPYDQGNKENPTVPENSSTATDPIANIPKATSENPAISTNKSTTPPTDDTKLADATKFLSLTEDNKHTETSKKSTTSEPADDIKPADTTKVTLRQPDDSKFTDTTHKSTDTTHKSTLPPADDTKHTNTKMSSLPSTEDHPVPKNPNNAAEGGPIDPHHSTEKTGVKGNMGTDPKASVLNPSSASTNPGGAPDSGNVVPKQQGADKPSDAPNREENSAVKATKEDAEQTLRQAEQTMKNRDPNDHSGEPMHMHDGSDHSGVPPTQAERRDSKAGMPGGQEHGKTYGTGEQWVKTSGVAAQGGDFDVTKPGAGREATRLLEQKGVHRAKPGDTHSPQDDDHKEKVSVGEKIKNKLHIGSHK